MSEIQVLKVGKIKFGDTVEPVYYGHLGTNKKSPDYQGVQVSLYDKASFGTITKRVDYTGVLIFKCPD